MTGEFVLDRRPSSRARPIWRTVMIRNILSKVLLVSVVSIRLGCAPKPAWAQRGGGFHGGGGGSHAGPGPVYPRGSYRSAPYTSTQRMGRGPHGGPGGAYGSHVY